MFLDAEVIVMNKTSKEEIGKRIRDLRKKRGEKQKDLAELLSATQNSISKVENGTSGLSLANLIKVAEHYNVSLDYLCKGEGGTDILDTLKKYIGFCYSRMEGISDDNNSHLIPFLSIDSYLFRYFSQVAHAKSSLEMPENIKETWISQAEKEFRDTIIKDTYSDTVSFIPLRESVLEEQEHKIIYAIEKHIQE